jgi:alpha-L-rhamnosidase
MINQLHSNIYWTQRMNFIDIPTDCPQRDERLGWTGDAQVYIRTAAMNTDVHAFFTKWLQDLADAQRNDGQFPMVAPLKVAESDGGPAWADAGVICPWTAYQVYGDKQLLERQYPSMVKFIEFCKNRSTPELLPPAQFHCFGDWLNIDDNTPNDVIYTAYFALSTKMTAQAAQVLGKTEDARKYNELYQGIKAAFNKAYVAADGKIKGDTQTAYVLAIAVDLVDGPMYKTAANRLVGLIEKRNWHLSTGFIGTKDLMLVLAKIGRNDVACRLLHNDTFPSWGFSIKHGATSIWERWNGWTPEQGFGDPGMNSFAHYSFGAVYQWMVENLGGIQADDVAYKKIIIKPCLDEKLTGQRHPTIPSGARLKLPGKKIKITLRWMSRSPPIPRRRCMFRRH